MRNVSLKMPDRIYEKLENYKKENNITMTQAVLSLIEKGFIKKANDYQDLISFFQENFSDKHKDELLRIESALRKIYDKVSAAKPIQTTSPQQQTATKKLTAEDMFTK